MAAAINSHVSRARWDGILVLLAFAHGALLLTSASIPLIAILLWWNANTISHNFIHRPFFRSRAANLLFSLLLTLELGFPQSWWRARHLRHHGVRDLTKLRIHFADVIVAVCLWCVLLSFVNDFVMTVYLPGFALGLVLCYLQGHYEHARGTTSHYGWLYNFVLFNDGYHVEHHLHPGVHWRELPAARVDDGSISRWPAVIRWVECLNLCALERLVLRSSMLRNFVVSRHQKAFRKLSIDFDELERVAIVGGGLFPRTAIILSNLCPRARLTVIDMSADNISCARRLVDTNVAFLERRFDPQADCDFDLIVIPLAYKGDRDAIYGEPPARLMIVHDWIWRCRGESVIVSPLLLKRLNLVRQ
jgi:fatty acid desaturase